MSAHINEPRGGTYSIKMSNGEKGDLFGDEVVEFATKVATVKGVAFEGKTIPEALSFLVELDSRNSYHTFGKTL